jgi:hypothetical protein
MAEGMYGAMSIMCIALDKASKEQLISMVLTGLKREMNAPQSS